MNNLKALWTLALTAGLLFPTLSPPAMAELPFSTEEAETLHPGAFTLDTGFIFRNEPVDFGVEDRDRQWDLLATRLSFGLGRFSELQITGVAVAFIEDDDGSSTNSGDWTFGTKIWLLQEKGMRPALAFLYEVKLPNGSDEDGGATDETDFFGYILATKELTQKDLLHVNLGLGILGNPFANSEQNDIFILRAAWEHRLSARRLFGIEGILEGGPQDADDPAYVGGVLSQKLGKWALYGQALVGLNEDADEFRIRVGVRRRLSLWKPGEPVRRNSW